MPCYGYKSGNASQFICGGRRGRAKQCFYCRNDSDFLCDYPVGKKRNGKNKDCDRPLCSDCTKKGVSPNVDFCRQHYELAKAAYERRTANKQL